MKDKMSVSKAHGANQLERYYIKSNSHRFYTVIPSGGIISKDKNGVVLYKVPYTSEYHYYPVYVAEYAIGNFDKYIETKDEKYKENFLKQIDWLVENISDRGNYGVWEHYYKLPYYDFGIPWVHGMAQGLAVSALLRAYNITNKDVFLETARKAYGVFEIAIKGGGVRFVDKNGNIWLEEYGISPPAHILNGFIFALFGVYDFFLATKEEKALNLWREGIKTVETNLPQYDLGYWSLYNLVHEHPAPLMYHTIHINQLSALYSLTGKKIFMQYAAKWEKCLNSRMNRGKASFKRGFIHLKTHGVKGCIDLYLKRKKWSKAA